MTILAGFVRDIGAFDDHTVFTFSVPVIRDVGSGAGVVTTREVDCRAESGVLTTPDLAPGPCELVIQGDPRVYRITIPDSADPVLLWPLVQAATPPEPGEWATGFVANGGGVARVQAVPLADYPAMEKDPATLYALFE